MDFAKGAILAEDGTMPVLVVGGGAIGIAVLVGIISGIYPARKATKMSPLEAMRSGN